jgi:hypothetical protein
MTIIRIIRCSCYSIAGAHTAADANAGDALTSSVEHMIPTGSSRGDIFDGLADAGCIKWV